MYHSPRRLAIDTIGSKITKQPVSKKTESHFQTAILSMKIQYIARGQETTGEPFSFFV
jgi:hypothetical protein